MAAKTEREKGAGPKTATPGATQAIVRTDTRMTFRQVTADAATIPDSLGALLAEGFETQRHVKLIEGDRIDGVYRGMEDGELSARVDRATGEVTNPAVKWVYIEQQNGVIVRLLGAYNMISQLAKARDGARVVIARGSDYDLGNGFRCTDYLVFFKNPVVRAPVIEGEATRIA